MAQLLKTDLSCTDLLHDLRTAAGKSVMQYGLPGNYAPYDVHAPMPSAAASAPGATEKSTADSAAGGTSTTNVQEIGVDEPDVVKTDGDRVITVTAGVLRVIDAATRKVTGSLDLTIYDGASGAQLLVDGDRALVMLGADGTGTAKSTVLFVDLAGTPAVTGTLRVQGSYVDARMIDGTVRLVASSAPRITFDGQTLQKNRAKVKQAPIDAWLPTYEVTTGGVTRSGHVACGAVSHPADFTGASMLTVYTLSMSDLGADPSPVTVAADGDTVYASRGSLYIASNPDWWGRCIDICPSIPPVPSGSAGLAGSAVPVRPEQTELHRFDINGTSPPRYLGSGTVPGRLLSSYSLSEYDGALRVATTSSAQTSSSAVYALDAARLSVLGHVDGLGKGEQIYAVRFAGPLAYVVTFRQTDPLYVVDLRKPSAPKVTGELQLTGYSSYLHPVGADRLIGVGQEASLQGRVAGMQVSLFDVANPSAPSRVSRIVEKESVGENTLDPHAFLYWAPTGLVVVPMDSWDAKYAGQVLVLKVTASGLTRVGTVANPGGTGSDGLGIARSMIVDGSLWTFSAGGVKVSSPTSLAKQAWIAYS